MMKRWASQQEMPLWPLPLSALEHALERKWVAVRLDLLGTLSWNDCGTDDHCGRNRGVVNDDALHRGN
jgi:hypothetical protein